MKMKTNAELVRYAVKHGMVDFNGAAARTFDSLSETLK